MKLALELSAEKSFGPVGGNGYPPLQGSALSDVHRGVAPYCGNKSGTAELSLRLLMIGLRDGAFFVPVSPVKF